MHPIINEFLAGGGFTLGNFIFMMRKNIINAAGMNIEMPSKIFHTHRGTFDMPAGTPLAERRFPENCTVFRFPGFPKRKIANFFFLVGIIGYSIATPHFRNIQIG
ncbi:MAG: hypothetical protein BWX60_01013 [Candidatus Marinimicrobia bacterium ADurb.Bin030]|nr:MAG: hypothetical protein BWX60_01013 [Candidatus Marinimicrobia bacterium ADurb.Bin030]